MSMRYSGLASRIFIIGIKLCPPLKIFAASPCCFNKPIASDIVSGRQYSNDWGIIFLVVKCPGQEGSTHCEWDFDSAKHAGKAFGGERNETINFRTRNADRIGH